MKKQAWGALALVASLSPVFGADTSAIQYRCVPLEDSNGGDTFVYGASANGHIAGIAKPGGNWPSQAAIWYRRDEIKPTGMSFALAVNDHGHMVGEGVDDSDGFNRAMLWKDGSRAVLPALPGSRDKRTSAEAINNKGQAVGGSSYGTSGGTHAVLWVDGTVVDLGALGGDAGPNSFAYDINRYGDIVGTNGSADVAEAVFWKRRSHRIVRLPKLTPDGVARAFAINAGGLIVGEGNYPGGAAHLRHALAWTTHDSVTDLGTLSSGKTSHARAVNNNGVIVGDSAIGANEDAPFATVWYAVGQAPVDLNTVLAGTGCRDAAGTRYVLESARGITDGGTIVANAMADDGSSTQRAFRLIPRTVGAQ